jgi:peptidoglycan hydrolase CwlO-like protein
VSGESWNHDHPELADEEHDHPELSQVSEMSIDVSNHETRLDEVDGEIGDLQAQVDDLERLIREMQASK